MNNDPMYMYTKEIENKFLNNIHCSMIANRYTQFPKHLFTINNYTMLHAKPMQIGQPKSHDNQHCKDAMETAYSLKCCRRSTHITA